MSITRDDALNWIKAIAGVIGENSAYLTELDAAIGDADHGANMDRGFQGSDETSYLKSATRILAPCSKRLV